MGSMKSQSLRYEVLVCPQKEHTLVQTKKVMASSNPVQPFLAQTQVRRFTIDENMQQYWIPDGYYPVLVPRPLIQSSIATNSRQTAVAAGNEFNNVNVCPLRQTTSSLNTFDGNVTHRTKRRRLLGSRQDQMIATSHHSKVSLITFYAASLYYKQKLKELIANGVISNPPSEPPSKIIGKMWYEEPESTRKYYERLVLRLKTLKCENDNKKLRRPPIYKHQINPNSRHESRVAQARKQYHRQHSNLPYETNENPIKRPSGALDKHYNESNVYKTSSEDFTISYRRTNNKNVSNTEGGDCNSKHQFSIMMNADDPCRESFIISSSPKLSANRINNDNVNDAHNADWMTRSNEEDLCDTDDTNY